MTDADDGREPDQTQFRDIDAAIRADLHAQIDALTRQAHAAFSAAVQDRIDNRLATPPEDYLRAVALQHLFCRLCGGDPLTLAGGDADKAATLLKNLNDIAKSWAERRVT